MSVAYVDSSALIAVAFNEPTRQAMARRLEAFSMLLSSNLLEAELRAACHRERQDFDPELVDQIEWVLPGRPLTAELAAVMGAGYLRGADLWHVACALVVAEELGSLTFLTLDQRQRAVAEALGFAT